MLGILKASETISHVQIKEIGNKGFQEERLKKSTIANRTDDIASHSGIYSEYRHGKFAMSRYACADMFFERNMRVSYVSSQCAGNPIRIKPRARII